MRKLVLQMSCGVGTDISVAYLVPEEVTEEELANYAWQQAVEHASMYGIYPKYEEPEDYDENQDFGADEYSDDIEGWWEEYDAKKHDGRLIFGSNSDFEWNEY